MSVRVICYSGATYAECPRAVEVDGLLVEIEEVISRWRTPEGLFFRVRTRQEQVLTVVYVEAKDEWIIASSE